MKSRNSWILTFALMATLGIVAVLPLTEVLSASTVVVTPTNTEGWSTADTRPGGAVNFVTDSTAPSGCGALQLVTDASVTAKAQYLHAENNTPLGSVTTLSYYTKQVSGPPIAAPAYQVIANLLGTSGFTTLVFEPYQNPGNNGNPTVVSSTWQEWDVDSGLFWSTRTVSCPNGTVVGTPGGPATYTLAQLNSMCPGAVVIGYGVNIGQNNPAYNVYTDLFNFNGTTYDFEPDSDGDGDSNCADNCPLVANPGQEDADNDGFGDVCDPDDDNDGVLDGSDQCPGTPADTQVNSNGCPVALAADQCKNGGWQNLYRTNGTGFKNQGDCVSYTKNGK